MIYLSRLAQSVRSLTRSHWFSLGKLIEGKELTIHSNSASVIVLRLPTKYLRAVRNSLLVFHKTKTREYRVKNCQTKKESPSNNRLTTKQRVESNAVGIDGKSEISIADVFLQYKNLPLFFLNSDLNRNVLFT